MVTYAPYDPYGGAVAEVANLACEKGPLLVQSSGSPRLRTFRISDAERQIRTVTDREFSALNVDEHRRSIKCGYQARLRQQVANGQKEGLGRHELSPNFGDGLKDQAAA
jgi:hypothetical protein